MDHKDDKGCPHDFLIPGTFLTQNHLIVSYPHSIGHRHLIFQWVQHVSRDTPELCCVVNHWCSSELSLWIMILIGVCKNPLPAQELPCIDELVSAALRTHLLHATSSDSRSSSNYHRLAIRNITISSI